MDYRDPESALRAKKEALQEQLAETDRSLRELEEIAEAKKEKAKAEPAKVEPGDASANAFTSVLAMLLFAFGVAGALVASTRLAPWTFDHAVVAGASAIDPTLEGRIVIVTAPITARQPARDDELLAAGDEVALERVVETGHWHAAYRTGGRGGGEHPAGYSFTSVQSALNVSATSWRGRGVHVGAYDVDLGTIGAVPFDDLPVDASRVQKRDGPLAWDSDRQALSATTSKELHADIVLVRHRALRSGTTVTVFGVQRGNAIVPISDASDKNNGLFMVAGDSAAIRRSLDSSGWSDVAPIAGCLLCIILGGFAAFTEGPAIFVGGLVIGVVSFIGLIVGIFSHDGVLSNVVALGCLGVLICIGSKAFSSWRAFLLTAGSVGIAAGTVALAPYLATSTSRVALTTIGLVLLVFFIRRAYGWANTIVDL